MSVLGPVVFITIIKTLKDDSVFISIILLFRCINIIK